MPKQTECIAHYLDGNKRISFGNHKYMFKFGIKKPHLFLFFEHLWLPNFKIILINEKNNLDKGYLEIDMAEHYNASNMVSIKDIEYINVQNFIIKNFKKGEKRIFPIKIRPKFVKPGSYAFRITLRKKGDYEKISKIKLKESIVVIHGAGSAPLHGLIRWFWVDLIKVHSFSNLISSASLIVSMIAILISLIALVLN